MNSNDRSSSRDEELQSNDSRASMKKSVDEFLDELEQTPNKKDAWSKIADDLNAEEAEKSDWNVSAARGGRPSNPQTSKPTESDGAYWDGGNSNNSGFSSRQPAYRDAQDENKFDEDYETRSRNRAHSVWNKGEWSSPNGDGRYQDRYNDRRDDRRDNYGYPRERNYGDYPDDRRSNAYRQDYRGPNRPNDGRPGDRMDRDYEQSRPDDYRRGPNDGGPYRNGPRYAERRDGGYRQNNYGYRQNNYRGDDRRPMGERRDYRRDPSGYQPYDAPNDYRPQGEDYRQGGRRDYRNYGDRDDYAGNNWRRNDYGGGYYGDQRRRSRYNQREPLEPTIGALGKRGEPLSLAEDLAARRYKRPGIDKSNLSDVDAINAALQNGGIDGENLSSQATEDGASRSRVAYGDRTPLEIVELEKMTMQELVAEARRHNLETSEGERRHDLTVRVLRARLQRNGMMFGEGTLEILPDEFGFLRSPKAHYISCPDDIYISPSQIRRFGLRNGLTISGQIRPPKERERYFALLRVESINGQDPNLLATKPYFDDLVVARPSDQLKFESSLKAKDVVAKIEETEGSGAIQLEEVEQTIANLRAMDLVAPIAFGQRELLVCPSRAGEGALIRGIASSILANNPDVFVFVVLLAEHPEEISEAERRLQGPRCEVVSSAFDESPSRHIQSSEIAFEKAKRMVEYGQNVVIVVDSFTNLAKAWNAERMAADVAFENAFDPLSIQRPKKLFCSARKIDGGGSLSVVGAIRYEENDSLVRETYEELKSVANAEVWLDGDLIATRAKITIDPIKSRARDVKDFFSNKQYAQFVSLQKKASEFDSRAAAEFLADKIENSEDNAKLFAELNASK